MNGALAIIARDGALAFRAGGGAGPAAGFFLVVALLFALSAGPEMARDPALAAPVIWTAAFLAAQLSLDPLFRADAEDGSLDAILETVDPPALAVLAKAGAHWLTTGLALTLLAPLAALGFGLSAPGARALFAALLIGAPGLSLIGAFAAALTASLPRSGVLIALIASPLAAPILIFGAGASAAGAAGDPQFWPNLFLLAAASLLSLAFAPIAGAAALRSGA